MSVTEVASATGEWNVTLRDDTPQDILDKLDYFGHVAIVPGRVDPAEYGDSLLDAARFVGVNQTRAFGETNKKIGGPGMAFWLGDSEDKGAILETPLTFTNATFTSTVGQLLPDSVQPGTISALPGLYNGVHSLVTPRKALDYVLGLYNAEWRLRGSGVIDVGLISDLYVTQPKTAILRNRSGLEMDYRALKGAASLDSDVKDFTTRVLMLAQGQEGVVSGTADIDPSLNPYLDLFGNPVQLSRVVQENATSEGNADARAQLQLNRFSGTRDALKLTSDQYDIRGDVECGDYVWVYDPAAKLLDVNNQIEFHGETIWPMKLRVFQLSWPVQAGMGVLFRTNLGEWIDLTDWFVPENGTTNVVVGGYNRSLSGAGSSGNAPGSSITDDTTTPDVVEWVEPFVQATYQSELDGLTRAQVVLTWDQPLNTDGSVITDGFAYEIRWRTGATRVYPITHEDLALYRHNQLDGTFGSPITYTEGAWQSTQVGWDFNQFLLQDLTPGIPYDFQIRALDSATPTHVGDFSEVITIQTRPDTVAPSTPAPPDEIAGSRNALQIVHYLGRASGGTFNLESDINHLRIHADVDPSFFADDSNLLGKLPANQGMLRGQIPVVGTVPLRDDPGTPRWIRVIAVDNFGNESSASDPIQQTAVLIDSAFIDNLTVSKVSAGTILANWLLAAEIATALSGARVKMGWYGIEAYNLENVRTFYVNSLTGDVSIIGTFQSGVEGRRVRIRGGSTGSIDFMPQEGETRVARIVSYIPDNYPNDIAVEMRTSDTDEPDLGIARVYVLPQRVGLTVSNPEDDTMPWSFFHIDQNSINGAINDQNGDNNGGYLALGEGTEGFTALGKSIDGLWNSWMEIADDGNLGLVRRGSLKVRVVEDGIEVFPYVYASMYSSVGNGEFRGKIDNGGATDSFGIRNAGGGNTNAVLDANGFSSVFVKNFVIEHPEDTDRWLVHACTESPVAGVEYSGIITLEENFRGWVDLPDYFEAATEEDGRQVFLTVQLPEDGALYPYLPRAVAGPIRNGRFFISSDGFAGTRIAWLVKAVRSDVPQFPVEPLKSKYTRAGEAPYTWLEEK